MLNYFADFIFGNSDDFELEHRCYNGVCLAAGFGCLSASFINPLIGISPLISVTTFIIGTIYLWLYSKSRREDTYQPILWLYMLIGIVLLVMTWFFNGGINGSDILVSMIALVAMTVVMKTRRFFFVFVIFFPVMSLLFLTEYLYPELIIPYDTI